MQLRAFALAPIFALVGTTAADEGVLEINQARALAGGVSPFDTPGFPVSITEPGSYRLTSNLDRRGLAPDVDAVLIAANPRVTLDLNGFEIIGENDCSPMPCTILGAGRGIVAFGDDVNIVNGGVRGMPGPGISINGRGAVSDVTVSENGGDGISVGIGRVTGCLAQRNYDNGVRLDNGIVRGTLTHSNRLSGFVLSAGSLVESEAFGNGGLGLSAGNLGLTGYGANVLICNNGGVCNDAAQSNGPVQIGANVCGSNSVCP
jgi:hypothetical protein